MKLVHTAPAVLTLLLAAILSAAFWFPWLLFFPAAYLLLLFLDSWAKNGNFKVAALSMLTGSIQVIGYGYGFLKAFWTKKILRQPLETKKRLTKLYNKG